MSTSYSNRLCNPSPRDVLWKYDKGVVLTIPADGHLDLPSHIIDDFRSDKPGYEAVKTQMDSYALFLRDPTLPYEVQAIEALEAAVKSLGAMYDDAYNNMRRRAAAAGTYDEEAFAETLAQQGYASLKEKVEQFDERLKRYRKAVGGDTKRLKRQQFDPERTLMFLDPPKEFESKIAMSIFLSEPGNEALRDQHEAWVAAQGA